MHFVSREREGRCFISNQNGFAEKSVNMHKIVKYYMENLNIFWNVGTVSYITYFIIKLELYTVRIKLRFQFYVIQNTYNNNYD